MRPMVDRQLLLWHMAALDAALNTIKEM